MKRNFIVITALALSSALIFAAGKDKAKKSKAAKKAKAPEFVRVESKTFVMGNNEEHETEHEAWVSEFYICTHEVTQEEYKRIMKKNPSKHKGKNLPVENVSWYDAIEYCNRLSLAEGYTPCYTEGFEYDICADGYRLPTETEWEFAARGGNISQGFTYSGSDDAESVAWYMENSGDKSHEVMEKEANELGIYDMSGNVAEWCWDWYGDYPSEREDIDPTGPSSGEGRIIRGGSYGYSIDNCSSTFRNSNRPDYSDSSTGFRVVRSGPRG